MSIQKFSAMIPLKNQCKQKEMEVIFDLNLSEILSDSFSMNDLLESVAKAINTSGVNFDREEVGNE